MVTIKHKLIKIYVIKKKLLENDKHKYNEVQIAMKNSKLLYQVKISVSETF